MTTKGSVPRTAHENERQIINHSLKELVTQVRAMQARVDRLERGPSDITLGQRAAINAMFDQGPVTAKGAATPRSLEDRFATTPTVLDYGARGDGTTDDTSAIQAAITANYGRTLLMPKGTYKISAALVITNAITIVGDGWEPYTAYASSGSTQGSGTWINPTHTGTPAFDIKRNGSARCTGVKLMNFAMKWSQPTPGVGFTPTSYEWAIRITSADDILLENLMLLNPTKGIQLTANAGETAGRLTIRGLSGQPLSTGIEIAVSYDVTRISDVHFWPFWSDDTNVLSYTRTNAYAFISRRNDNPQYVNLFTYGYFAPFCVSSNGFGTTSRLTATNLDFDDSRRGFWVDTTAAGSSGMVSNLHVTCNPVTTNSRPLLVESDADWDFQGMRLSNAQNNAVEVSANGAYVKIFNTWIDQWNITATAKTGLTAALGATIVSYGTRFTQGNGGANTGGAGTVTVV